MRNNITTHLLLLLPLRLIVATTAGDQHNATDFLTVLGKRQQSGFCMLNCYPEVLPHFDCPDLRKCICSDDAVADALQDCVTASGCSIEEALQGQKIRAETCGFPKRNRVVLFTAAQTALFAVAVTSVVLRGLARTRRFGGAGHGTDDTVLFATCLPMVGFTVVEYLEQTAGLGQDIWELNVSQVENMLKLFYIGNTFYSPIVFGAKIAFVLLYLRIWKDSSKSYQWSCKVVLVLLVVAMVGSTLTTISLCTPVFYNWKAISGASGTCVNREAQLFSTSAINIAMDFVVLLLPVPRIAKLSADWPKKIGFLCTFLVGLATIAASIAQYYYLITRISKSENPTWDYFDIGIWRMTEIYLAIICCCIPMIAEMSKRALKHASNTRSVPSIFGEPWSRTATLVPSTKSEHQHDHKLTTTAMLAESATLEYSWLGFKDRQNNKQSTRTEVSAPDLIQVTTPGPAHTIPDAASTTPAPPAPVRTRKTNTPRFEWDLQRREHPVRSNPRIRRRGYSTPGHGQNHVTHDQCDDVMKSRISRIESDASSSYSRPAHSISKPHCVDESFGSDRNSTLDLPVGRASRMRAGTVPSFERGDDTRCSRTVVQTPRTTRRCGGMQSSKGTWSPLPELTPSPLSETSGDITVTPDQVLTWARQSQSRILHQAQMSAAAQGDPCEHYAHLDERMRLQARNYSDRALPQVPDDTDCTVQWI